MVKNVKICKIEKCVLVYFMADMKLDARNREYRLSDYCVIFVGV
jgi:hypothetical protein